MTEHYSVLGAEVSQGPDGEPLADPNQLLVEELVEFDSVIVAGQAKSHCVAWTVADFLDNPLVDESGFAGNVYLLEDCTSPVVVPGVADFTESADEVFRQFEQKGVHLVESTTPMDKWPDLIK